VKTGALWHQSLFDDFRLPLLIPVVGRVPTSTERHVFHAEMVVRSLTFQLAPLSVPSDLFGRD
jgi:hypothetical protein